MGNVVLSLDGNEDFCHTFTEEERCTNEKGEETIFCRGSSLDGYLIVRGPITFTGHEVADNGGVHFTGTPFEITDGRYKELCWNVLLQRD